EQAPPARGGADRPHEFGKAVVGEHGIGRRDQAQRIGRHDCRQPLVAVGHDHPLAAWVDENRRQRRRYARHAMAPAAIDVLARERAPPPKAARGGGGGGSAGPRRGPAPAGPRGGPASATRPPSRATATAALAAQPPLTTK